VGQPKMVIPLSRSSLLELDSIGSDIGWLFQESSQLRNALIKAIAHKKAEPIKACVSATSNSGNDVGDEVSVNPVDDARIDISAPLEISRFLTSLDDLQRDGCLSWTWHQRSNSDHRCGSCSRNHHEIENAAQDSIHCSDATPITIASSMAWHLPQLRDLFRQPSPSTG